MISRADLPTTLDTRIGIVLGMPRKKDLTGIRFGKLVAIKPAGLKSNSSVIWKCRCDCGNTKYVGTDCLTPGKTRSCGCANDGWRIAAAFNRKHGHASGGIVSLTYATIYTRVRKGWAPEEILSTKRLHKSEVRNDRNKINNRFIAWKGETRCLVEWAQQTGISRGTIAYRLDAGWSVDQTLTIPSRIYQQST